VETLSLSSIKIKKVNVVRKHSEDDYSQTKKYFFFKKYFQAKEILMVIVKTSYLRWINLLVSL